MRPLLVGAAVAAAAVVAGAATRAPSAPAESQRAGIETMMRESAAAWNRGDLDAFVGYYLDSDRTSFVGSTGVMHGRGPIRARYVKSYFGPGMHRDSLHFEKLEVDSLAPDVANAIAFYVLTRRDSVVARGPTSLVMQRVRGRWYIVHDHSS